MISVIIPLYNKASYIEKTMYSVLAQTYFNFEIIVVNDGSTDTSVYLVESILDERIRIVSIENAGVSVARNTGIKAATYPWIALIDGDDWWAPTFLEEMIKAIAKYPEEVLFASGRSRVFGSEIERYSHSFLPKDGETQILNYFKVITKYLPLINSSNVMIKRSHFEEFGYFRVGQKQHEDHDLWMRLATNSSVVFINKNLSFYRKVTSGSASTNQYTAIDFNLFLNTIQEVRAHAFKEDSEYLRFYASNFALLTYIKNSSRYSKEERIMLSKTMNNIVMGPQKIIFTLIKILPINLYPILKKLKI